MGANKYIRQFGRWFLSRYIYSVSKDLRVTHQTSSKVLANIGRLSLLPRLLRVKRLFKWLVVVVGIEWRLLDLLLLLLEGLHISVNIDTNVDVRGLLLLSASSLRLVPILLWFTSSSDSCTLAFSLATATSSPSIARLLSTPRLLLLPRWILGGRLCRGC